jgi:bacillithiol synthase
MIIPLENIPGVPPITFDFISDYSKVSSCFNGDFRNIKSFVNVAEKTGHSRHYSRSDLCHLLLAQNKAFGCGRQTEENIKALAFSDALVVATGQQVGLFSGPLYTIYKACTVIRYAQELGELLRVPVVPLFYLVAEDHDFDEVQWAGFVDKDLNFNQLIYRPGITPDRLPVCQLVLEENVEKVIFEFEQRTPPTEFKIDVLQSLRNYYHPGQFFHLAFAGWFSKLFSQYGIVLFDSSNREFKTAILPLFEEELVKNLCSSSIEFMNTKLERMGYKPQIEIIKYRPQVAILKNGRHSLKRSGADFVNLQNNEVITAAELLSLPEILSPKAAFRPLVQDFLFPTVAYVGGPAEIAYWAQLRSAYEAFNLSMPVVIPRAGFTLLEPKIKKYLSRFEISPVEFIADSSHALQQINRKMIPTNIVDNIDEMRSEMDVRWNSLEKAVIEFDPNLQSGFEKTKSNCFHYIDLLEKNIVTSIKNKSEIASRQTDAVFHSLLPNNSLQERQLNILNYLIRYDWSIIDRIVDEISPFKFEHKIVEL